MPGRLYKRGPIWWCWFYSASGKQKRRSTRCTDRKAAAKQLQEYERKAAGLSVDKPTDYPIKEAVADFLGRGMRNIAQATKSMYRQKAGHLNRLLGDRDAALLSFQDVQGYVEQRIDEEGAAVETVKKEMVTLRQLLKFAAQRQIRVADSRIVIPSLKTDYVPRTRFLTEAEYTKLLFALPVHRRDFVRIAVYTGARKSELENLNWSMIDFDAGIVRLPGTKTVQSRRAIPIKDPLRRCLEAIPQKKGTDLVLERWQHVDRDLMRACKRAAIERVSCNDLRRTFASWLLQQGVKPFHAARLLGHASLTMVYKIYGQLTAQNLSDAIGTLPDPERDSSVIASGAPLAQKGAHDAGHSC